MKDNSYLGKGWSFPPHFDNRQGVADMVSGEAEIKQSLEILLSTQLGERYLVPSYGCNVDDFQFKKMTNALRLKIKGIIGDAIKEHEQRIILKDIILDTSESLEGKLIIDIQYIVKDTYTEGSYVYPYYNNK